MLKKNTKNAISRKLRGFRGSYFYTRKPTLKYTSGSIYPMVERKEEGKKLGKEAFDDVIVVD